MTPSTLELGSRFRTAQTQVPQLSFVSGGVSSQELPRSFLYKTLVCRLSGSITIGTGTGAMSEGPLGLIQKCEIIADGRKVLVSANARDLFRLTHIFRGKRPELNFSAATGSFSGTFAIDMEAIRMVSPVDSFFDPRPYEKIEIRITWGTISNILTTPGTASITSVVLDVQVLQTTEGADAIMFNKLISFDENTPAASSQNLTINVPRSGILHGILFRTDTLGIDQDNIINFVTVKSDNNFLHVDRLSWATLQRRNVFEFQLDGGTDTPGSATLNGQIVGFAFLDLTEDGLIGSGLNTLDLNVLQLILDVTFQANNLIRITYIYYEPIQSV
jgi:hypothetical protein